MDAIENRALFVKLCMLCASRLAYNLVFVLSFSLMNNRLLVRRTEPNRCAATGVQRVSSLLVFGFVYRPRFM